MSKNRKKIRKIIMMTTTIMTATTIMKWRIG